IQATGHADLVDLDDGTTWAVFLGIRPLGGGHDHILGRETFLAPVRWSADGWPMFGDAGHVELRMDAPALPAHPWPAEPPRDAFDAPALGPSWNFVRNPAAADWSLGERRGFLRLHGSAVSLDDVASPALVVRRQQHFDVRCQAAVEFAPKRPNEEAGLTVRATEAFRYELAIRLGAGGRREAILSSRIAGRTTEVKRVPLADGPVRLEVAADQHSYRFRVAAGRGEPIALGALPVLALSAEAI